MGHSSQTSAVGPPYFMKLQVSSLLLDPQLLKGEHPPGPVHGGSLVTSCSQPFCPFLGMNQSLVQCVPPLQGTFQTSEKSKRCSTPTSPIKFSFVSKRITKQVFCMKRKKLHFVWIKKPEGYLHSYRQIDFFTQHLVFFFLNCGKVLIP